MINRTTNTQNLGIKLKMYTVKREKRQIPITTMNNLYIY